MEFTDNEGIKHNRLWNSQKITDLTGECPAQESSSKFSVANPKD